METPARKAWPILVSGLLIGLIWDQLFLGTVPGISVTIFCFAFVGIFVAHDRFAHRQMAWREILVASTALVLSIFFAIRQSPFLLVLDAFAILYLILLFLASMYRAPVARYGMLDFLLFPLLDVFTAAMQSLPIVGQLRIGRSKTAARVCVGAFLAFLVGTVFISLFASADLAVKKLLDGFVLSANLETLLRRLVDVVLVGFAAVLALAPAFWRRVSARTINPPTFALDVGVEATVVFAISNALFLAFLAVQFVYLFGGERNIERFDVTYAEYARHGFFQLLLVALIVAGMVWAMRYVQLGRQAIALRVLQTILLCQTGVVLVSSWTRLSLYEQRFGFTHLRLFSHYFLLVLAGILLLLIGSLFLRLTNTRVLAGILGIFLAGLIGLNVLNPDVWIAKHNLILAQQTGKIDIPYLFSLSDDAAPILAEWIRTADASSLREARPNVDMWLRKPTTRDWQSWNFARWNGTHERQELSSGILRNGTDEH